MRIRIFLTFSVIDRGGVVRYQAILFDLDGTLLPMHEPTFVKCFYGALIQHVAIPGVSPREVGEILQGSLRYVISNDGSCTNRQAFADYYENYHKATGHLIRLEDMENFYATSFDTLVRGSCGFDPSAKIAVEFIKNSNTPMAVATNPFFPRIATHIRLGWAGLDPADFHDITVYENSHYCKPNLLYYRELFERIGFDPEQCLMVGNNVAEDMIATQLGCDVFLVTRDLINPNEEDISSFPHGNLEDLINYLKNSK